MARRKKSFQKNYAREASSFIMIALGIILMLAILSYDRADDPNLKIDNNSIQIKNFIGPAGAAIAAPLMNYTLGYPILFLPIIIILVGLQLFRGNSLIQYLRPVVLLTVWAVFISIVLALPEAFETYGKIREYYPSGVVGGTAASYLIFYLGKFGTILILATLLLVLTVVTLRLDLVMILDYIINNFKKLQKQFRRRYQDWLAERNRRKKQAFLKRQKYKIEPEIINDKPLEIKTGDQAKLSEKYREKDPLKTEKTTPEEKPMIKTILDDVLEQAQSTGEDDISFEVEEEVKVEEIDYDRLVKESIAKYEFPSVDLLESAPTNDTSISHEELKINAAHLEAKLMDFGLAAKVIRVTAGPVITLYELQPAPGVKVSQIVALSNDLALAMEARGIRMVAPIPGKAAIGIEIPNRQPQTVYLKPIIRSETYVNSDHILPLALGKTINGEVYCADLTKMPHLLIAGSTGSGKSVGINTIIASIFYRVDPGKVKFVLIDPKKIELSLYRALSEHYLIWRSDLDEEVITKPSNAVSILNTLTVEMEKRYDKLAHLGVRNIEDYNMRVRQGGPRIKEEKLQQLPYIIIIIDELADLMMIAAKEVENPIARLTQMARAVGIHLILATQRPSVDVLTGVIKANFPARIAYMVTTRPDSKTILDMNGAEQLLGNGDMLYQPPGEPRPIRLQNPLITTREVERLISHIKKQPKLPHYSLPQPAESRQSIFDVTNGGGSDELYENAKQIVVQHQQGSISLLQRRLKIGYSRAARLIDDMEEEGVVGPAEGSKPRQVFYLPEDL
ncbi:MAG: DNA translocase FtsK 4TM domain-containing protein [Calditrichia bacterium]|nr:DNA translocase FtsK 4TM domain-containing protein [Calditrichia bacterium]